MKQIPRLPARLLALALFLALAPLAPALLCAQPMRSPTWGFRLDLPPGYVYVDGNAFDRFSFQGPSGAMFDIVVYSGVYRDIDEMMQDAARRIGNAGGLSFFDYGGREAAIMELRFGGMEGWALGLELAALEEWASPPLLLALAYAPEGAENVDLLHISALNSIAPTFADSRRPGPIMEFAFPRGEPVEKPLAGGLGLTAMIRENDALAAQELVDREFLVLKLYQHSRYWQEAWIRFYRAIHRDSWDRVADAVFQLERRLSRGGALGGGALGGGALMGGGAGGGGAGSSGAGSSAGALGGAFDPSQLGAPRSMDIGASDRAFAQRALGFVQGFYYERDLEGSDFVNLVTAVTEGRGDCDSRAMLWAMILAQANIPAAIMVSRHYSHAMGLADVPGAGARFEAGGVRWLVAETTDAVDIGLIAAHKSSVERWLGVIFE